MNVVVIHEKDHDDGEQIVIGVATSIKEAEKLWDEYYGQYEELQHIDRREEGNLEYSKILRTSGGSDGESLILWDVTITLEWFKLNQV